MKPVAEALGVSRSNLTEQKTTDKTNRPARYSKEADEILLPLIRKLTDERASYGYRRITAMLNRDLEKVEKPRVNGKRIYRIMKANKLLLERHTGKSTRTHDGKIITLKPNLRWCSDTLTIRCWNGEKVEVAFSLDCCDREAMSWVATTTAISGEMIRDLIVESVEKRFGTVDRLPHPVQWLSDNGGCYTADETRGLGESLGFIVCTTPAYSPESNGMSEAFVKTLKRDYVYLNRLDDPETVLAQLPKWFEDYNENAPHKGLKMRSPRQFRREVALTN